MKSHGTISAPIFTPAKSLKSLAHANDTGIPGPFRHDISSRGVSIMAEELRDLRAKISVQTDAALDAHSRVTGRDRSELVREILHRWSLEQIAICTLLDARLRAEGITAASEGASGSVDK